MYNYVLLKMSTWYSKHVEESNNIWRINNIQCITLVVLYGLEILFDTLCVHIQSMRRRVAGDVTLVRCAFCRSRESELLKDVLLFLWTDSYHALSCLKFYKQNCTLLYSLIVLRCTQFIVLSVTIYNANIQLNALQVDRALDIYISSYLLYQLLRSSSGTRSGFISSVFKVNRLTKKIVFKVTKKCKRELLLFLFILRDILRARARTHTHTYNACLQAWLHVFLPFLPIVSPGIFLYQLKGEVSMQRANFPHCARSCRSQHIKGLCVIYLSFWLHYV